MNAAARKARRQIREMTRTQRASARIARRGNGSIVTHLLGAGLTPTQAASMAGTLRKTTKKLGITGTPARVHRAGRMRDTTRYTPQQIAAICTAYKPRKAEFKAARERLLATVPATRQDTYRTAA